MARFQFQVSDPEGRVRKGTMEARTLAEARDIALKRGYTIIELREVSEAVAEPKITVHSPSKATTRYHAGPAPQREYRPGLVERLQSFFPTALVRGFLGLLMLVGAVWMVVGWRTPQRPAKVGGTGPRQATPTLHAFKLLVEGSVTVQGSSSLGDVQVMLDLPEIPYQQTYDWSKMKHPRNGHFVVQVEFESTRRARQLIVRARKPGLGEVSTDTIRLQPGGGKVSGLKLEIKAAKGR